jgi:predicted RNase H-like nuclease
MAWSWLRRRGTGNNDEAWTVIPEIAKRPSTLVFNIIARIRELIVDMVMVKKEEVRERLRDRWRVDCIKLLTFPTWHGVGLNI